MSGTQTAICAFVSGEAFCKLFCQMFNLPMVPNTSDILNNWVWPINAIGRYL